MPLLHQDASAGGRDRREHRRSFSDFLATYELSMFSWQDTGRASARNDHRRSFSEFLASYETFELPEPAAPLRRSRRGNDGDWLWEEPGSPEAAQTPRALVPDACFPPRHPRAFASYSESARPGTGWGDENGQGITDLVASLKALAMPAAASPLQSFSASSNDLLDNTMVESKWPPKQASPQPRDPWPPEQAHAPAPAARDEQRVEQRIEQRVTRRASFSGVVSGARASGEAVRWCGSLPARCADAGGEFSPKVFLGGLPWDITETAIMQALKQFQPQRVEWPGRDGVGGGGGGPPGGAGGGPRGYAYVTLESERRVRSLLAASRRAGNDWYYRVVSRKMRTKEVQVIPWAVSDSNWMVGGSVRLEPARTVFVGALHGMLSASALATIMNDLFAGVVYAGIDTDKNRYPIGSGRVTFNNVRSYVRAISAGHVEIHTDKFTKKVQVDPYLEDSMCSVCNLHQGPYFCREPRCFRYFCRTCWSSQHVIEDHKPLMRNSKSAFVPSPSNSVPNGSGVFNPGLPNGPGPSNGPGMTGLPNSLPNGPGLPNGTAARRSPSSDHGSIFNGSFSGHNEGTPSPPMSGASGMSVASGMSGGSGMSGASVMSSASEPGSDGSAAAESAWPQLV